VQAANLLIDEDEEDMNAVYAARDAEMAAKYRGLANAARCLACEHMPPDYLDVGPDWFCRQLREDRRLGRIALHAQEDCDTCPYLPENYGKPVRCRVLGVDGWGDHAEADRIRQIRFREWEARHATC